MSAFAAQSVTDGRQRRRGERDAGGHRRRWVGLCAGSVQEVVGVGVVVVGVVRVDGEEEDVWIHVIWIGIWAGCGRCF